MVIFLLVYLGVYGGVHVHFYFKVQRAFPGMGHWRIALATFLVVMIAAPIVLRLMERSGMVGASRALAPIGYSWIAVVFWFFTLFLCVDLWNLGAWLGARFAPAAGRWALSPRVALGAVAVLVMAAIVWGRVEAERPDIVVSTGDLLDVSADHIERLAPLLADMHPPLGKFAVTGNHEHYAGLEESLVFHEAAGFRVLRGESVVVGGRLCVAGVDDPAGRRRGDAVMLDERKVLASGPRRRATVLLKHRPAVSEESLGRFDVQLSGHTHGGQIFPFTLLARLVHGRGLGLHQLEKGSALYISRGAGTWGPPMRVLAPPEITVVTLAPRAADSPAP